MGNFAETVSQPGETLNSDNPQLYFEVVDTPAHKQPLKDIGLQDVDLLEVLAQFDPYGVWRMELETGLLFWSRDVFEVHEMTYQPGPVDLRKAIDSYHPDDREMVINCIEEAASRKTGFRFVLRLQRADGSYKLVKCIGRYRLNSEGGEEIYGTVSQFQERIRSVAINS
jgi:hypothetical protein